MIWAEVLFWGCILMTIYVYLGYPICLFLLSCLTRRQIIKKDFTPMVTFLISVYNEEKVIRERIENLLQLDYPKDKLEIIIISDGSTDKTDEIVKEYEDKGIILKRLERGGKLVALNKIIPTVRGEIVILSDANVFCQKDTVRILVRNFYKDEIGCVSGDVRLLGGVNFENGESLYYKYERFLQKKESEIHSLMGADGALYAIRKKLYSPPPPEGATDDFVISMEIAKAGYRAIYEEEAKAFEDSAPTSKEEFRKKVRVVAAAFQCLKLGAGIPTLAQPVLLFEYISHKLLRWFIPFFLIGVFVSNLFLLNLLFYQICLLLQLAFYTCALCGIISKAKIKIFSIPLYFCIVNAAAFIGFFKGIVGGQSCIWEPVTRIKKSKI